MREEGREGIDDFSAAVADVLCVIVYTRSISAPNSSNSRTRPNQLRAISYIVCFGNGDACFVSDDPTVCLVCNEVHDFDTAAVEGSAIEGVRVAAVDHHCVVSCIPS